ncbi:MAG TPA: ABC transporter permease [Acidimicrobiales bacterium]|jgi:simple sugar transport system permease protein|nr:ABC transporter permease [Acidimicrobiales bacterium]
MTIAPVSERPQAERATEPPDEADGRRWWSRINGRRVGTVVGAYVGVLVVFGIVLLVKSDNPFSVVNTMLHSTILNWGAIQQTILRAVPISLAALAVAIPARAGLVNVGGEGQLIMGAVAATGVGLLVGATWPGPLTWVAMGVAGAAAGAIWAGVAGLLRTLLDANEAVTTLLMNFVANDLMLYLIYQPWKYSGGSGQPESKPLASAARLPQLLGSELNLSVIIAVAVALAVWIVLRRSGWGFALRIVGGNPEAARRAGLPVKRLLVSSMVVGGALAGLGGMVNFAGLEQQLRPDITATFGYVAFLASFLGRHDPPKVVGAAVLFSAIAVSGNGIQLAFGIDGGIVDVLLALIVIAPLFLSRLFRGTAR